jgi:hypothetical protein
MSERMATALKTADEKLRRFIDATAKLYELPAWVTDAGTFTPGELLEAMILTESSGRVNVSRYEPHLDKQSASDPDTPGQDDGLLEDDKSYGPMQVLGLNVRAQLGISSRVKMSYGFMQSFGPGVISGVAWLLAELRVARRNGYSLRTMPDDVTVAVARYNGGPRGNPDERGVLRTKGYVEKVKKWAKRVSDDRRQRDWLDYSVSSLGDSALPT